MQKGKQSPKPSQKQSQPSINQIIKSLQFPLCKSKKQSKLVCLNPDCQDYPFFCTTCENEDCQIKHQHGNKLLSVGFKQYIKRVLKDLPIDQTLEQVIKRYKQCLEKLKNDVEKFVEKEFKQLEEIKKKSQQLGEQQQKIKKKLRNKQYNDLTGHQLDYLWQKVMQFDRRQKNKQTTQFLQIKQQQIKQISDNFQKVNQMSLQDQLNQSDDSNDDDKKKNKNKLSPKISKNKKQSQINKQKKQKQNKKKK